LEVITTHLNADFDGMASMMAAKKLYPEAVLTFSGSQEKGLRDFLIRSTFYAFDFARLKDIDLNEITRLILVDINDKDRIGPFKELIGKKGVDVHIYDHHPIDEKKVESSFEIIKDVGATTTIFAQIFQERNISITPDEATIMMLGIYEDTGSLTFTSTTTDDFMAAAYFLENGANLNIVSDMLTRELSSEQVELLGVLLKNQKVYNINGIDVTIITVTSESYVGDLAILVHKVKDIENLNVLFVLALLGDRIYFIGRSRIEEVDAGEIAIAFGGGGHPTAASASIKGMTLVQAIEKLLQVLKEQINPVRLASDIMSFPVKSVSENITLSGAGEVISRYNVNVLAVVEKKDRLAGTISRQTIERGIVHKLGKFPVKDFMNTDLATVDPDTTLQEVQSLIIEGNQRFLPVVKNSQLVGAITRTDLLRALYYGAAPRGHSPDDQLEAGSVALTRSVIKLMEERLTHKIIEILKDMGKAAEELGFNAYVVGGFVRDLWLRRENFDIDIVIEGDGIAFAKYLEKRMDLRIRTHKKFGTATITYPDGFKVDVATARTEYYNYPGALPIIEGSTLKLDLYRRDFIINTLAVKLNPRGFGILIDFFGALRDLKSKTIRIIQNLSFVEDPTRVFRAIRFEQRFNYRIGKQTEKLIKNAVKINVFERLKGKRLYAELKLIFDEEDPYLIIERLESFDLLKFIHPKLTVNKTVKKAFHRVKEVSSWYDLLFMDEEYDKRRLYFYALTFKLNGEELDELLTRLMFSPTEKKLVTTELDGVDLAINKLAVAKNPTPSDVYTILKDLRLTSLLFMLAISTRERTRRRISKFISASRTIKIETRGKDLVNLGFEPGDIFGEILDDLLMLRLDGKVDGKKSEIEYVKKKYLPAVAEKPEITKELPKGDDSGV
jgi:tRNA nucleotidyltransferase (CCA-adding enzyme)